MDKKLQSFDGSGDVKIFIEKISLHSAFKGFEGEKAAQNLASRLEGRAFDVYLRLSDEDKKDPDELKDELMKEFELGNQDREIAIHELSSRARHHDESPQTFAFKVQELVKLAYPTFDDEARQTVAKDYFVKGLHQKMQIALKSLTNFSTASLNDLAKETTRLQIAGIESFASSQQGHCMSVNTEDLVDSIADKVLAKMKGMSVGVPGGTEASPSVNYFGKSSNRFTTRGKNKSRPRSRNFRGGYQPPNSQYQRCRSCQSTDHYVRECPSRFCQACGNKGHDSWDKSCPNYQ